MMTPAELHILQHSLGLDQYGRGRMYRDHFCTGEGSIDHPHCMTLVAQGYMTRRAGVPLYGGDDLFRVTPEGVKAMREQSPAPPPEPKRTRSQQRYLDYLNFDSGLTFGEYLKSRHGRGRPAW